MLMRLWIVCFLVCYSGSVIQAASVKLADGFDFPVGKPDAKKYYKARGMRLRPPVHFGEDWNGKGGGNTDLNDPIYTCASGIVVFAHDCRGGWGRVLIIRHAYRGSDGKVKYCDSLYGHLRTMSVKLGDTVERGQQVGTMGNNRGMYAAHLHFEIRHNLSIGMHRESVPRNTTNWADPTGFIRKHRTLKSGFKKVKLPMGTFKEYKGSKGL